MRSLVTLALGLFIPLTLAGSEFPVVAATEHKGAIGCDNKGESFAAVVPTGPDGSMKSEKLYHGVVPVEFIIEKVSKVIGYVCMQHHQIVFYQGIRLPAKTARDLKAGDSFIWEAGLYELSLSSEQTGMVIATWTWIVSDVESIAELAEVDYDELEHILK